MSLRLLILASPRVTALFSMVTGLVFGLVDLDDAVLFGGELAEADDTSCGESTSGVEAGVWVMWSDWAAPFLDDFPLLELDTSLPIGP